MAFPGAGYGADKGEVKLILLFPCGVNLPCISLWRFRIKLKWKYETRFEVGLQ